MTGVLGVAAIVDDVTRRRISNWIPAAAFLGGLGLQTAEHGLRGGLASLLGAAAGACVFLLFYLLGGMGGGDIKLMAGFGAILGSAGILEASLWTAGCGGVLALGFIAVRALRVAWSKHRCQRHGPATADGRESIPYAPAIALGVWLSLVARS